MVTCLYDWYFPEILMIPNLQKNSQKITEKTAGYANWGILDTANPLVIYLYTQCESLATPLKSNVEPDHDGF